jgi:hypothetical protein
MSSRTAMCRHGSDSLRDAEKRRYVLRVPLRQLVIVAALGLALGCEPTPFNETPEGAVRELVSLLRGFAGEERDAKALYDLLSERARANLQTRAERYGAASGKTIAPWAMLVPSRMMLSFVPQAYASQIVGKYALVDVVGVTPDQHAQVPCVIEDGLWRVDLVLPELPEVEQRPGMEER